jgi:hypothetical protein
VLKPQPLQAAPAQLGGVGHPPDQHGRDHDGDQQEQDQEADRPSVAHPGDHPGCPEGQQGHEPQPHQPVPGQLLGGRRQPAQAQPLAQRGQGRRLRQRALEVLQPPVRAGRHLLVEGPLDRVGGGLRGGPGDQPCLLAAAAARVGQGAAPEQVGGGGEHDQVAAAVELGGLVRVEAGRAGRLAARSKHPPPGQGHPGHGDGEQRQVQQKELGTADAPCVHTGDLPGRSPLVIPASVLVIPASMSIASSPSIGPPGRPVQSLGRVVTRR